MKFSAGFPFLHDSTILALLNNAHIYSPYFSSRTLQFRSYNHELGLKFIELDGNNDGEKGVMMLLKRCVRDLEAECHHLVGRNRKRDEQDVVPWAVDPNILNPSH